MSGYTIVNLIEIENGAVEGGSTLDARFTRSHLDSEHLGVGASSATPPTAAAPRATATSSRKRCTSFSAVPGGSSSTTRCTTSASGTSSASRLRPSAALQRAPTASSCSRSLDRPEGRAASWRARLVRRLMLSVDVWSRLRSTRASTGIREAEVRSGRNDFVDPVEQRVVQVDVVCAKLALELLHRPRTDDRRCHRRVVEHERDRQLDQRHPRLLRQLSQCLGGVELALISGQREVVALR